MSSSSNASHLPSPRRARGEKKGIHQVARLAGVSMSTVSRVMNGAPNVDAKLQQKVWKAIAAVDYVPNRHAQALVSGRTRLLGLLVPEITNPFFPELIHGFEEAALAQGFGVLIGSTNADASRTSVWVQRMLQHAIEGLALLTFKNEPAAVYELLSRTPVVQVEVGMSAANVQAVEVDYQTGIRQAVQHLAYLGHREIAFASGAPDDFTAALRLEAFRIAMREIGAPVGADTILEGNAHTHHTLEGGIEAAQRLLTKKRLPTGLICSNDLMAIGALREFTLNHIQVPRDLSLIGLDDIHLAEFTSPPLTTVRIPRMELAQVCFDALFQTLTPDVNHPPPRYKVATSLVVRESTRHARLDRPTPAKSKSSRRLRPAKI